MESLSFKASELSPIQDEPLSFSADQLSPIGEDQQDTQSDDPLLETIDKKKRPRSILETARLRAKQKTGEEYADTFMGNVSAVADTLAPLAGFTSQVESNRQLEALSKIALAKDVEPEGMSYADVKSGLKNDLRGRSDYWLDYLAKQAEISQENIDEINNLSGGDKNKKIAMMKELAKTRLNAIVQRKKEAGEELSKSEQSWAGKIGSGVVENLGRQGEFIMGLPLVLATSFLGRANNLAQPKYEIRDGDVVKTAEGELDAKSIGKAAAGAAAEVAVEAFLGKAASKTAQALGVSKIIDPITRKVTSALKATPTGRAIYETGKAFNKFSEITQIQGLPTEYSEEIVQKAIDDVFGLGKRSDEYQGISKEYGSFKKDMADPKFHADLILGIIGTMGIQGGAAAVQYGQEYNQGKRDAKGFLELIGANKEDLDKLNGQQLEYTARIFSSLGNDHKFAVEEAQKKARRLGAVIDGVSKKIVEQEGFDSRVKEGKYESMFMMPSAPLAVGESYQDKQSGISWVQNRDGKISIYDENGDQVSVASSPTDALEQSNYLSKKSQAVEESRSKKASFIQLAAQRLAGDIPVTVYNTEKELAANEPSISQHRNYDGNTSGVYQDGRMVFVLDNIHSPIDAAKTVMHEAGVHAGLRRLLGDDDIKLSSFLDTLDKSGSVADAQRGGTGKTWRQYVHSLGYEGDRVTTEEALAYIYENKILNPTLFQRGVAGVRAAIRKINPKLSYTQSDVEVLLKDAHNAVMGKDSMFTRGAVLPKSDGSEAKMAAQEEAKGGPIPVQTQEEQAPVKEEQAPIEPETVTPEEAAKEAAPQDIDEESINELNSAIKPQVWIESLRAANGDIKKADKIFQELLKKGRPPMKKARTEAPPVSEQGEQFLESVVAAPESKAAESMPSPTPAPAVRPEAKPASKDEAPAKSAFKAGQKVSTVYDKSGVAYSGDFVKDNGDGTITVRAFSEKRKGQGASVKYGVSKDGKAQFKDVTVPSYSVRSIDATADVAKMSPAERDMLKIVRQKEEADAAQKIKDAEVSDTLGEKMSRVKSVDRDAAKVDRGAESDAMFRRSGANIEVAPNPNDKELNQRWMKLPFSKRMTVTKSIAEGKMIPMLNSIGFDNIKLIYTEGGFEGNVNPSILMEFSDDYSFEDMRDAAIMAGAMLDQDSVIAFDENITEGEGLGSFFKIIPSRPMTVEEETDLYNHLSSEFAPLSGGFSAVDGALRFGNFTDIPNEEFQSNIQKALEKFQTDVVFSVYEADVFRSDFIDKLDSAKTEWYNTVTTKGKDYGKGNNDRNETSEAVLRNIKRSFDSYQAQARAELRDFIAAEEGAVGGGQGGAGVVSPAQAGGGGRSSFRRAGVTEAEAYHWGKAGLTETDPAFHGTGIAGAEKRRKLSRPKDYVNRTYFGGKDYAKNPEFGKDKQKYSAKIDMSKMVVLGELTDPQRAIWQKASRKGGGDSAPDSFTFFEKMLKDNGYAGIYNPNQDVYIMFSKVKVTPVGKAKQTMFRRSEDEKSREEAFAKIGLPVITVPDSIQRALKADGIEGLAENLRGAHRKFQETKLGKEEEVKSDLRNVLMSLRNQETSILDRFINKNNMWISADEFYKKHNDYAKSVEEDASAGAEHIVYVDPKDTTRIVKMNNMAGHTTWLNYLHTLAAHNVIFPESAYRLEGFIRDPEARRDLGGWKNTDIRPVVSQQYFRSEVPADSYDMKRAMRLKDFEEFAGGIYKSDKFVGISVFDLHNGNGIVNSDREVVIFDPAIEIDYKISNASFRRADKDKLEYPTGSAAGGYWTAEDRKKITPAHIQQRAEEIANMDEEDRDKTEFLGPIDAPAYMQYLISNNMPKKDGQWKSTSNMFGMLLNEYDQIVNVNGAPYLAVKDENPYYDEDDNEEGLSEEVWSFYDPKDTDAAPFVSESDDKKKAHKELKEYLNKYGAIRYRRTSAPALDTESFAKMIQRKMQDYMLPVKDAQALVAKETKSPILDNENVYAAEDEAYGKIKDGVLKMDRNFIDKAVESMKKNGVTVDELDQYLMAMAGADRNRMIADRTDGRNMEGSGHSDAYWADVIDGFVKSGRISKIDEAAQFVWKMNEYVLELKVKHGLLSRDQADTWLSMSPFYVPFRTDDLDADYDSISGNKASSSLRKKESASATGRTSEADTPFAFSVLQAYEAVARAHKNDVHTVAANLAHNHPHKMWKLVDTIPTVERYNKDTGKNQQVPDGEFETKPNVVIYKENGDKKYIVYDGKDGLRFAQALNRESLVRAPAVIGAMTRAFAMMRTSLVPTFMLRNLRADLLQMSLNMTAENRQKLIGATYKNLPSAWKAVWTYDRDGKASGSLSKWANEFFENGGQIAGVGIQAVDKIHKGLRKHTKQHGKLMTAAINVENAYEYVDRANGSVETGTRLALYAAMRESGMSIRESIEAGKNITVNFNRKGELGPVMNAVYMFSNVAIQDAFRTARAINSKQGYAVASGVVIAGFLAALLNNGDGDDDEYKNIPESEKKRNIIIKMDGKYVKQPIRGLWALLWYAGTKAADVYAGGYDPAQAGLDFGGAAVDTINFLGTSGSWAQFLSPTITDPLVQAAEGKTWAGTPMYQRKFNESLPDSETGLKNTPSWMKDTAKWLNSTWISGGDEFTKGRFDIAPETIKHVIDTLLGGVGTDISYAAGFAQDVASGNLDVDRIPVVRDVVRDVPDDSARFYDRLEKFEDQKYRYDGYKRAVDKRRVIQQTPYMRPSTQQRLADIAKQVKELRKLEKEAVTDLRKERYQRERLRLQARFIAMTDD